MIETSTSPATSQILGSPRIVLLDSDHRSLAFDEELIRGGIPDSELDLIRVVSGLDFLEVVGTFESHPPAIVIGNLSMRALDPVRNMPNPPDFLKQGSSDLPNTNGLRCLLMVAENPAMEAIALVLNTDLNPADLRKLPSGLVVPDKIKVLSKTRPDYHRILVQTVSTAIKR